jgi:hypothetical protein
LERIGDEFDEAAYSVLHRVDRADYEIGRGLDRVSEAFDHRHDCFDHGHDFFADDLRDELQEVLEPVACAFSAEDCSPNLKKVVKFLEMQVPPVSAGLGLGYFELL